MREKKACPSVIKAIGSILRAPLSRVLGPGWEAWLDTCMQLLEAIILLQSPAALRGGHPGHIDNFNDIKYDDLLHGAGTAAASVLEGAAHAPSLRHVVVCLLTPLLGSWLTGNPPPPRGDSVRLSNHPDHLSKEANSDIATLLRQTVASNQVGNIHLGQRSWIPRGVPWLPSVVPTRWPRFTAPWVVSVAGAPSWGGYPARPWSPTADGYSNLGNFKKLLPEMSDLFYIFSTSHLFIFFVRISRKCWKFLITSMCSHVNQSFIHKQYLLRTS